MPQVGVCKSCNFVSSQEICKACFLLQGLNRGLPKLGIGKTSKSKKMLAEQEAKDKLLLNDADKSCNNCTCNKSNKEINKSNISDQNSLKSQSIVKDVDLF